MVDGVAEVRIAVAAVAREVLRGHGHARRVQARRRRRRPSRPPPAGRHRSSGRRSRRSAGPSSRSTTGANTQSTPIERGQLAQLHPERPRPPRRPAAPGGGPSAPTGRGRPSRVTRPPSSSTATSRCSPRRARRPATRLGRLLLVLDVLVAEHHPADARADQPVDERVVGVGDPGQPDHEHQAGPVLQRGPGAHVDRARRRAPSVVSVRRLGRGRRRSSTTTPPTPTSRPSGEQRDRPPGPGRPRGATGQVLRYVAPASPTAHEDDTRQAADRGTSAASARRSIFCIGVSGRPSTMRIASGSL